MRPDFDRHEFYDLVNLITSKDPSLTKLPLVADGTFQTLDMTCESAANEVANRLRRVFEITDPEDFPHLYYGCGRARGGSTSLTNVFGMAGISSYYQPVKSVLRHVLTGTSTTAWTLDKGRKHAFAKETFGPYTLAECLFQPLDILIAAGYPASKIDLIVFDREPMSALSSWLAKWSHRLPAERLAFHFVLAGLNVQRVKASALSHGIRTTTYVYEVSKDPVYAIGKLFERLGIPSLFSEKVVTDWRDSGDLASDNSAVIFPDEPQIFEVPGLHGSDSAYRFHARAVTETAELYTSLLRDLSAVTNYQASVESCISDLRIDPAKAELIFGVIDQIAPKEAPFLAPVTL